MLGTGALEKDFRGRATGAPDLARASDVADGAAAGRALEQFFGREAQRFHRERAEATTEAAVQPA